jgi:membrane associated rhomboid family serine protease
MAFRSNGPVTVSLPPFRGVTRRIILTAVVAYLVLLLLHSLLPDMYYLLEGLLTLRPGTTLPKQLWELLTYPFFGDGLISVLFAALSVWYCGSMLEDERGQRWLGEFFLVTTIGGGLLACLLGILSNERLPGIGLSEFAFGLWPFALALVMAFASFHPEQEMRFYFVLTVKAKYLAAIYLLLYLAFALAGGDRFGALAVLCNAAAGYGFLRLAPRRGVRAGVSEQWFALRNSYYRAKRRRAAKKFTVYMKKQGKEVSLDDEGRYIDPNGKARDLNDRNWMN